MPLSKTSLAEAFVAFLKRVSSGEVSIKQNTVPLMPKEVADGLAQAYHDWTRSALAGGMLPIGGDPSVISAQLQLFPLMAGWGPGTVAYWSSVLWALPGVSNGVTIPVTMAKVSVDILAELFTPPFPNSSSPKSVEEFADKLAGILYSNTTSLIVTQTVISTGITAPVPVS